MIVKPPRPVLQRGHPLARGLVGAWPMLGGHGSTERDLVGRYPLVSSAVGSDGPVISRFGKGRLLTPSGGYGAGNAALRTVGMGGVVPAFPITACGIFRTLPTHSIDNQYLVGRWSEGTDWLIAWICGLAKLHVYQGDQTSGSWRYWAVGTITTLEHDEWFSVSYSLPSGSVTPTVIINGILYPLGPPTGGGAYGGTSGAAELRVQTSFESVTQTGCADVRLYNRAISLPEHYAYHADPWAVYRPARRTLHRTSQGAARRGFYTFSRF